MDTASSSRVDGRLDQTFSASASGGSFFCFAKLGMGGFFDDQYCLILTSILILDLLKMIFYLLYGKSTIWGIYRDYVLFFGGSLSKSMLLTVSIPAIGRIQKPPFWCVKADFLIERMVRTPAFCFIGQFLMSLVSGCLEPHAKVHGVRSIG
jgi:hypothetical protein